MYNNNIKTIKTYEKSDISVATLEQDLLGICIYFVIKLFDLQSSSQLCDQGVLQPTFFCSFFNKSLHSILTQHNKFHVPWIQFSPILGEGPPSPMDGSSELSLYYDCIDIKIA